jgi:hypothetical protein
VKNVVEKLTCGRKYEDPVGKDRAFFSLQNEYGTDGGNFMQTIFGKNTPGLPAELRGRPGCRFRL